MNQPTGQMVVALDLGGTFAKVGLAAPDGTLSRVEEVRTELDATGVLPVTWLIELVVRRAAEADAQGIRVGGFGVAVPGIVSDGWVHAAVNLGWYDVALADRVSEGTGLPGQVGHDVRAGGLAEWRLGSGAGLSDFVFLPLGTGIAGAIVCDGRMLVAGGHAGEIGHVRVAAAGDRPCACGRTGCLETVSSAAGVRRTYAALAKRPLDEAPDTAAISRLARQDDAMARAAFDRAGDGLAEAVELLATLFGPERISIGGGLAGSMDLFADRLAAAVDTLTFQRRPELMAARFGSQAGLIGAGLLGCESAGLGG